MGHKTYRFAIIGTGAIGTFHAELLQQIDRAQLVAICDRNPERGQLFAERFGCKAYTNLDDMLADCEIDIVNICSPSSMHGDQAITCAKAGKHVMTEKPMDISLDKADQMIEAFHLAGTLISVISQYRLEECVSKVKHLIEQGAFGKLVLGTGAINWYRSQEYYDSSSWRGKWAWDGGGALMNQGIHIVDLLQYIMGPVESVFAQCDTLGHDRIEVEDAAVATLRFRNGALGTLLGTTTAFPGLHTRIEIFGTKGSAVIENGILVYCKYKNPEGTSNEDIIDERDLREAGELSKGASNPMSISGRTHKIQFEDMIKAIDEKREPFVNGIEGRKPLEIILAIYESNRSGNQVTLRRGLERTS